MNLKFAVILLMLSTSISKAEEVLLYDAPPPADAAFVRFLGFNGTSTTWNKIKFDSGNNLLSDYFVVHAGAISAMPGEIISVLPGPIAIVEPFKNPAKVTMGLVNLSNSAVELRAKEGTISVIDPVAPTMAGWREVNPVSVSVQVYAGDNQVGESMSLMLRRNEHHTILIGPDQSVTDIVSVVVPGVIE